MRPARLSLPLIGMAMMTAIIVLMYARPFASPPNVVLIIIDTLRQDKLSAYGFPVETSPEIDRLSDEGVRFEGVVSQSSWTRPSIGSMLTSQYPRTLGIYEERDQILPSKFVTLAEVLKQAGYTTIGATANPNINTSFNFHQGFDHYTDSDRRFSWMEPAGDTEDKAHTNELQSAREIFDDLLAQVESRDAAPYYLQANVMEVHEQHNRWLDLSKYEPLFEGQSDPRYLAAIRQVSAEIGRFVRALTAKPEFERTVFVIVSDHGEELGDHWPVKSWPHHGFLLYESQVMVPLILYSTDDTLPRGKVVETPSRLLDLMPTLLEVLGIDPLPEMAGTSMMGAIESSEPPDLPARFVVETKFRTADAIGAYAPRWEYIEYRGPHAGTSPRELQKRGRHERGSVTNQLDDQPEIGDELRAFLDKWERAHPEAPPTSRKSPLPAVHEEQLRALGYIE